jgi:hypothetical protein
MLWFGAAEVIAKAGTPVRRRAWLADGGLIFKRIVFVSGAGTTRAVAVVRSSGSSEEVVRTTTFSSADFLADDWETY